MDNDKFKEKIRNKHLIILVISLIVHVIFLIWIYDGMTFKERSRTLRDAIKEKFKKKKKDGD